MHISCTKQHNRVPGLPGSSREIWRYISCNFTSHKCMGAFTLYQNVIVTSVSFTVHWNYTYFWIVTQYLYVCDVYMVLVKWFHYPRIFNIFSSWHNSIDGQQNAVCVDVLKNRWLLHFVLQIQSPWQKKDSLLGPNPDHRISLWSLADV